MMVQWFDSSDVGAPALNNASSLTSVMRACLVTGYNPRAITSVSVDGAGLATAVCGSHGFRDHATLEIAGAAVAAVNGKKRVRVLDANTLTWDATGAAAGAVGGAITAKVAPLGWVEQYTSGSVSVFRRSDPSATASLLRVDDSTPSSGWARVRMFESMSDINTGTGATPTEAMASGGGYWPRGTNDAVAKFWTIVGDSKTMHIVLPIANLTGPEFGSTMSFGDLLSDVPGDPYCCALYASPIATASSHLMFMGSDANHLNGAFIQRGQAALGPVPVTGLLHAGVALAGYSGAWGPTFPSPRGAMRVVRSVPVREPNSWFGHPFRGLLRGVGHVAATVPFGSVARGTTAVLDDGRRWLLFPAATSVGASGVGVFDLDGPW